MISKGLIVSIQKYSDNVTQELVANIMNLGIVAIRTDQPIQSIVPIIGLKKLPNKKYYITTDRDSIIEVSRWANYVAIDCRKGNVDIELLLAYCHLGNIKVVADIESIDDIKNILKTCLEQKIVLPEYFATTFNFSKKSNEKANIIYEIKKTTNIPIIAEGGYSDIGDIDLSLKAGADNVCIGTAISDIVKLTKKYIKIVNKENLCY